jgi:dolichol-phosphate mannosyltransferase
MISIVIPTYNEKHNLPRLLEKIFSLSIGKNIEIIVVDDNSPDGTGKIAENLKKKYNTKREKLFVMHRKTRGRGTAGIEGFKEALKHKSEFIMEMDADFSHDPKYIPVFLKEIKNYDVVIGSRYVGGRILNRDLFRNIVSSIANIYNRSVLGLSVRDVSSGFKCYRREVMESLDFDKFLSDGYSIGAETIYRINNLGFKMKEVPIVFKNRELGESKLTAKIMSDYFIKVLLIRLRG